LVFQNKNLEDMERCYNRFNKNPIAKNYSFNDHLMNFKANTKNIKVFSKNNMKAAAKKDQKSYKNKPDSDSVKLMKNIKIENSYDYDLKIQNLNINNNKNFYFKESNKANGNSSSNRQLYSEDSYESQSEEENNYISINGKVSNNSFNKISNLNKSLILTKKNPAGKYNAAAHSNRNISSSKNEAFKV